MLSEDEGAAHAAGEGDRIVGDDVVVLPVRRLHVEEEAHPGERAYLEDLFDRNSVAYLDRHRVVVVIPVRPFPGMAEEEAAAAIQARGEPELGEGARRELGADASVGRQEEDRRLPAIIGRG